MVGEGWDYETLMRMRLSDFRFEFACQIRLNEARDEAIKEAQKEAEARR